MDSSTIIDLAELDSAVFKPFLNAEFTLCGASESFPVRLIEISELPDNRTEDARIRQNPFSLVFHCESAALKQGTYSLKHPELAPCIIFLSPFEGGNDWCKLEALFN